MSDIAFAVETYDEIIGEIKPMLPEHWAELAVHKDIPLDPDYAFYARANATGQLRFITVRKSGDLIGYAIWVVKRHPHYQMHTWALNDIVWLHPDHRGMALGRQLVNFWESKFTEWGVHVVHVDTKIVAPQLLYLLKGCGYDVTGVALERRMTTRSVPWDVEEG